jgi:hypothetical protein
LALAAGLAFNAVIGPLGLDLVDYPFSESIRNQAIGLEAVTLGLVVPWCLVAGALNWRGHRFGPVLAIAPGGYAAYMMAQYVVGPNYVEYAAAVPLHLALFVLGGAAALAGWSAQDRAAFRRADSPWYAWLALGIGLFVVSRYLPMLAGSASEEPLPQEFADDPAMFWTIVLLDLGVVVPAAVATAIALRRRAPVGPLALYALTGWFVLVPASVAAMAVVMLVNDDPNKSLATTVTICVAALAFTGFAWWVHTRLTSGPGIPASAHGEKGEH